MNRIQFCRLRNYDSHDFAPIAKLSNFLLRFCRTLCTMFSNNLSMSFVITREEVISIFLIILSSTQSLKLLSNQTIKLNWVGNCFCEVDEVFIYKNCTDLSQGRRESFLSLDLCSLSNYNRLKHKQIYAAVAHMMLKLTF